VLAWETGPDPDGWADSPLDRGGRTRYGISSRWHPEIDLDTLTPDGALIVYRETYWRPIQGARMASAATAYAVLDYAVHSGPDAAIRAAQRVVMVSVDGVVGPVTLSALDACASFVDAYLLERLSGWLRLVDGDRSQVANLFGWCRRLWHVRAVASGLDGGGGLV
jgi:lysozyme family protein